MKEAIRALVVDDDADSRDLFAVLLEEVGCDRVTLAESGRAALAALDANPSINLMLCDLRMPDMDGVALLRELPRAGAMPAIVLVSAVDAITLATAKRAAQARGLDVLGTVSKTDAMEQLQAILDQWRHRDPAPGDDVEGRVGAEDLHGALEQNTLGLALRPVVALKSGELSGLDVLPHWPDPGQARSSPEALFRTAARHNMLDTMVRYLFNAAGRASASWEDAGLEPLLFFGIHTTQLSDLSFPDQAQKIFGAHWLPPQRIGLRFAAAMADADKVACLDVITRLRVLHFALALETTAPPAVEDLPFQFLWLDPSLTAALDDTPGCRGRVEALVRLARARQARVVADGIDNDAVRQQLAELGCDYGLGRCFGPPLMADELLDWRAP